MWRRRLRCVRRAVSGVAVCALDALRVRLRAGQRARAELRVRPRGRAASGPAAPPDRSARTRALHRQRPEPLRRRVHVPGLLLLPAGSGFGPRACQYARCERGAEQAVRGHAHGRLHARGQLHAFSWPGAGHAGTWTTAGARHRGAGETHNRTGTGPRETQTPDARRTARRHARKAQRGLRPDAAALTTNAHLFHVVTRCFAPGIHSIPSTLSVTLIMFSSSIALDLFIGVRLSITLYTFTVCEARGIKSQKL